jgi:hypothetical protein
MYSMYHAAHVHVQDSLPMREHEVLHIAADADPGVVEEQIQSSVLGERTIDHLVNSRRIPNVKVDRDGPSCKLIQLFRNLRQYIPVDVSQDHRVASPAEFGRERSPDA